jgi:TolA-binding protein
MFTMAAALNGCGYDAGLENSLPLRQEVRTELQKVLLQSPEAAKAEQTICQFQQEHLPADTQRDIAQYVSLGIELGEPPAFATVVPEAYLPPDAAQVLGVVDLLKNFYKAAGIHELWVKHQAEYQGLVQQFHEPVASLLTQTDTYLKEQFGTYLGRRFVIYLEPLLAPGQVNSRNYGDNYFLVVSPAREGPETLRLHEIRHTYLHYVLDPLALSHAQSLKRLEPLLLSVQNAPLDVSFKTDASLMVNESLIRAIEARTLPVSGKNTGKNEDARLEYVDRSMKEGFILTHYFYEALQGFEKESVGLKNAYGDLLHNIDVSREKKRAEDIVFASQAAPEVVRASKQVAHDEKLLDNAEQRLASGDPASAQKLALQALNNPKSNEDPGRAYFILARAAIRSKDVESARRYFESAVQSAHDPRTLAWSHIYLGRIFDGEDNREAAVAHYRAALQAGDPTPDTKAAAEKGLATPFKVHAQQ